jgi:hypothetical protein
MSFTLTEALTYLQDYDRLNGSARAQRVYTKAVNDGLRELYAAGEFDFSTRVTRLSFAAPYSTGTVSINAGGTAVTGSGTTFTSAMVGRYIRFNGESEQYLIATYTGATSIAIEAGTYLGSANLSGVTYTITDERKALPTRCRTIRSMTGNQSTASQAEVDLLEWRPFLDLNECRRTYTTAATPRIFSTKWEDASSGNVPTGYVHVYPAANIAYLSTVYYSVWPVLVSSGSDTLPIPYEAEGVIREFMLAFLYREMGKEWMTQLNKAKAEAVLCLGNTRSASAPKMRAEWTPFERGSGRAPQLAQSVIDQLDP